MPTMTARGFDAFVRKAGKRCEESIKKHGIEMLMDREGRRPRVSLGSREH
jgi:hypothetical protein